ncbi:Variable outer membrane protein (plasmid) [Borrelia crocidurae DOU]|uniref:Variable large protein n=1 Tax=Borrelia crocidurae DOU TaxID=1293575 RepID=W5SL79_9SPIR|nr:Variable outer membrane protein [Borrelia crocidurae DOU]
MRKKGIILMMMIVMGCNSGVKDPEKVFLSEMVNLGKGFLDVFVSFGDMITGTLGIKAETKKEDIGKYFADIEETMQTTKVKLNEIINKNASGKGATDGEEKHAAAASALIGSVSGADILQAIAESVETKDNVELEEAADAASIAVAKKDAAADFQNGKEGCISCSRYSIESNGKGW